MKAARLDTARTPSGNSESLWLRILWRIIQRPVCRTLCAQKTEAKISLHSVSCSHDILQNHPQKASLTTTFNPCRFGYCIYKGNETRNLFRHVKFHNMQLYKLQRPGMRTRRMCLSFRSCSLENCNMQRNKVLRLLGFLNDWLPKRRLLSEHCID